MPPVQQSIYYKEVGPIGPSIETPRNSERARRTVAKVARRPVSCLRRIWAGSNVDRGHHWEENCTFKTMFRALQPATATWLKGRLQ